MEGERERGGLVYTVDWSNNKLSAYCASCLSCLYKGKGQSGRGESMASITVHILQFTCMLGSRERGKERKMRERGCMYMYM